MAVQLRYDAVNAARNKERERRGALCCNAFSAASSWRSVYTLTMEGELALRMNFNCPYCEHDLKRRQVLAGEPFGRGKCFDCPHCGRPITYRMRTEEIAAAAFLSLGIFLLVQYFTDRPFWMIFIALSFAFVAVGAAMAYLMRNKRRYEKGHIDT